MRYAFPAIFEPDEKAGGYCVYFPDLDATIPLWLKEAGEKEHVNFSQILQKGVKEYLRIRKKIRGIIRCYYLTKSKNKSSK